MSAGEEAESTSEAAAAESAVKKARQAGAKGIPGAVFDALEAAEATYNRQQQGSVVKTPHAHNTNDVIHQYPMQQNTGSN